MAAGTDSGDVMSVGISRDMGILGWCCTAPTARDVSCGSETGTAVQYDAQGGMKNIYRKRIAEKMMTDYFTIRK